MQEYIKAVLLGHHAMHVVFLNCLKCRIVIDKKLKYNRTGIQIPFHKKIFATKPFLLLEIGIIINKSTWTGLPFFLALSIATTAQQPRNVNLTAKRFNTSASEQLRAIQIWVSSRILATRT